MDRLPREVLMHPATAAAVRDYQGAAGLAATGVVAADTWQALLRGRR